MTVAHIVSVLHVILIKCNVFMRITQNKQNKININVKGDKTGVIKRVI